ncbi:MULTISPECIES: hypothetical protein [unclassified Streptomyces]|uniref:hypothetical protein n=1 Tax=unclassified Streptomyces TaxID=2593676 RepID=UPI002E809D13|nr:hypothetical protein [Streptomyces sp. NBC_00589]WTI37464.1 hypothetical protein OIC96_21820 [Streptomyces sp. NBC_00775]WUB28858.1 hypothetical protein OHA51_27915 [Streptomyces sp. NBC_00589]
MSADESPDRDKGQANPQTPGEGQATPQTPGEGADPGDGGGSVQECSAADWEKRRKQTWTVPWHFGYPKSVLMASSVGSPFLAGFSLTAAIVLISVKKEDAPTLVDWSVAAFVAAAGLFIFAVHATYWARVYITTPKEMLDWWPEGLQRNYLPCLIEEQQDHYDGFDKWHSRAKWTYTFGVLALFAGLALAVFPGWGATGGWWLAFGIASLAFAFEVFWQIVVVEGCLRWEHRVQGGGDLLPDSRPLFVRLIRPPVRRPQKIEMPPHLNDNERI